MPTLDLDRPHRATTLPGHGPGAHTEALRCDPGAAEGVKGTGVLRGIDM